MGNDVEMLHGLRVLAVGASVPTRVAAWWLGGAGAAVSLYRPEWIPPEPGSSEDRFERQTSSHFVDLADEPGGSFDVVLGDVECIRRSAQAVAPAVAHGALTVELTGPEAVTEDFEQALVADMALYARSSLGYLTREIGDDWELDEPCLPVNRQASILSGIALATITVMLSLDSNRQAQRVSVDQLELLALMPMQPIAFAQLMGRIVGKERGGVASPGGTLPTANGMAYVRPVEPAHWAKLLRLVGGLDWAADVVEEHPAILRERHDEIDERIRAWAAALTSEEVADLCQAQHVPVAPVYRPDQVVRDAHLTARGFVSTAEDDVTLRLPWLAEFSSADASAARAETREPGMIERSALREDQGGGLPLAGVRVLDLSWAWAGPFATTMFADLGAEVINVEWHPRASNIRRNPPFANEDSASNNTAAWWSANQRGKHSVGINMKSSEGVRLVRELAASADVVVENFSPGVVDRLGVGYEDLARANPSIVFVSLSAFGQSGPRSHYVGYGTQLYAAGGAGYATSQDSDAMSQMFIPIPDPISGLVGAFAMATFVRNARITGRSARVDIAELEAIATICLEPLLDALQESPKTRRYVVVKGADDRYFALLGHAGTDWSAVARQLKIADSSPEEIRAAAAKFTAAQVEQALEGEVRVADVADSADVLEDPYLVERGFWQRDRSPEVEATEVLHGGALWCLDGERAELWRGAPVLFGDTDRVLEQVLDYSADDIRRLHETGAIV